MSQTWHTLSNKAVLHVLPAFAQVDNAIIDGDLIPQEDFNRIVVDVRWQYQVAAREHIPPANLGTALLAHVLENVLGDLGAILTNLNRNDVLFIDEIHRLARNVEEVLYPAMEDFSFDFIAGKGPAARSIRIPLQKFTLIGATTRAGQLSTPLRDRFGVLLRLELYTPAELVRIIKRSAGLLGIEIGEDGASEIALRSRGTPRIANRLLKRVRDYAQVKGNGVITSEIADRALTMLEIDKLGLDNTDRRMLEAIIRFYDGGPVGLDTLAATVGEEAITIEDVYEPYLIQLGFLTRTPRGRCVTRLAYEHLGIPFRAGCQGDCAQTSFDFN